MSCNPPIELMTLAEAARKIGACRLTLARRVEANKVQPDAVLVEGHSRMQTKLFVAARLPELKRLLA